MSEDLRTGAVVTEGVHEVVWVRGPDTVRFLDGLVSQDVAAMGEGTVAHSLLLAPTGKLRAPHVLWRGSDEVALVTGAGAGEIAAGDLRRFKIRVDVTVETEERTVVTLVGSGLGEVLSASGLVDPGDGWARSSDGAVGSVPYPHGGLRRAVVVGVDAATLAAAGAETVERESLEGLRIELGEPVVGRDVGDSTIPQEMGSVEHAVSFTKGCYLGQELVARIDSRGHVNRHLRGIVFAPGDAPASGAQLVSGEAMVGELTSVAESRALGSPVGLALIRREVTPGSEIEARWAGGTAVGAVRELPLV